MDKLGHEQWSLSNIAKYTDINSDAKKLVEIPRFQRGIVWGPAKMQKFVDSLYRSFPVGSLLAFHAGPANDKVRLQLVDGLQRTTSISRFVKTPLLFTRPDHVFREDFFEDLARAMNIAEDPVETVAQRITEWFNIVESADSKEYQAFNFKEFLASGDATIRQSLEAMGGEIETAVYDARGTIQSLLNYQVPVLIYEGDEANIPEIFERINSQGAQLSKYDILASTWVNQETRIENEEVLEAIREKYRTWEDEGFEISEDLFGETDSGNLYEYLTGLGKVLVRKFPLLFGPNDDTVAFQICTVAVGLRVGEMRLLTNRMPKGSGGVIDPSALENAIFEVCAKLSQRLGSYTKLKLNKTSPEPKIAHSLNQIISLITATLSNGYDPKTWTVAQPKVVELIIQNAPTFYILDIMRSAWKGSGDSKLWDRTWTPSTDGAPMRPNDFYTQVLPRAVFLKHFETWHEDLLDKRQKTRPNYQRDVLAVLLFAYTGLISHLHNESAEFEIEHIYPVKYCTESIERDKDEGWPISALGNLMILPKTINRIKQAKLIGDELPKLLEKSVINRAEMEEIQKYLIQPDFTTITELSKIDGHMFADFCRTRAEFIGETVASNLGLK